MKTLLSAAAALAFIAAPASAATFNTLFNFNSSTGQFPSGTLAVDGSGTVYGTTGGGGTDGIGTVFSLTRTGTFTTLVDLDESTTGIQPAGGVMLDASGTLFGTTSRGGALAGGTVFSLTTSGTFNVLRNFGLVNGATPTSKLVEDASGTLFGTAGNVVYSLTKSGTYTQLHDFGQANSSDSGVVMDASGTLFGTTNAGGDFGAGSVFSLTTSGLYTTLASLPANNFGFNELYGSLALDASGTLFGVTTYDGTNGLGTLYSLTSTGTFTTLLNFDGSNGSIPLQGLIVDASGTLFGTTLLGGTSNFGTVFSLTKSGVFTTLVNFDGSNGREPARGNLFVDALGTLYGTTTQGGTSNFGTVFSITNSGFDVGGTGPIPEPASWAMLIAGFGLTGAVMRRRRVTAAIA
jgi:uncharacterized repeat protein (TIGR03803 family)